jgi:hypothetical protein
MRTGRGGRQRKRCQHSPNQIADQTHNAAPRKFFGLFGNSLTKARLKSTGKKRASPVIRIKGLLVLEQPDPDIPETGRLGPKSLARLGLFAHLRLDVEKLLIRPRPAAINPLLAALGSALLFQAPRLTPRFASDIGVARPGDGVFRALICSEFAACTTGGTVCGDDAAGGSAC